MSLFEVDPLTEFHDAIMSSVTKAQYDRDLALFFRFTESEGKTLQDQSRAFVIKSKSNPAWATIVINDYIRSMKDRVERREIKESRVKNLWKPIKLLLEENDVVLNWKKISRRIPKGMNHGNDRLPTLDEIKAIMSYPDRRTKPIVLTMVSSGIRLGAWGYLTWGDVVPIMRGKELLAAKLKIYAGTRDEYHSFITPEAYRALKEYMEVRESAGEKISPSSPLMRNIWWGDRGGIASADVRRAKRLSANGVKHLIEDAINAAKLRKPLEGSQRRHEFQAVHGFRKFFKSTCEGRVGNTLHVEIFMGHNVGLNENYYRPTEEELLTSYQKAIPGLTILEKMASPKEDVEDLKKRLTRMEAFYKKFMDMGPEEMEEFGNYLAMRKIQEQDRDRQEQDEEEREVLDSRGQASSLKKGKKR